MRKRTRETRECERENLVLYSAIARCAPVVVMTHLLMAALVPVRRKDRLRIDHSMISRALQI